MTNEQKRKECEQLLLFREHGMRLFLPLHQDDGVEEV